MGYTTVKELSGAIDAAARLAANTSRTRTGSIVDALPQLVDQVHAEAGVAEAHLAGRALVQARGDTARAVSLLRAWAATLPRLGTCLSSLQDIRCVRRITPAFREPEGGQYLGASLDYETRLLDLTDNGPSRNPDAGADDGAEVTDSDERMPPSFARALEDCDRAGLVSTHPPSKAVDVTRDTVGEGDERGAFLQLLARSETGAMTAMAYTAIRGYGTRQDPTLAELRVGYAPVQLAHPSTGEVVSVGEVPVTAAEVVLYRGHDDHVDPRFTLGVGATLGHVERRAISAAMLDGGCARARLDAGGRREPSDDEEFLGVALDGQEATGFLEHLKLPHHVTFTSDLDRIRAARQEPETLDEDSR